MPYRTVKEQEDWARKTLAELEEKVSQLALVIHDWPGLGEHPNPGLADKVDALREELLQSLRH